MGWLLWSWTLWICYTTDIPIAMDTWEGKGDQQRRNQHQQLIPRLILICCMVTMVSGIMDTMGTHIMVTGEEKGDQQSLRQKQQLRPRLIPGCCMEDITDMG